MQIESKKVKKVLSQKVQQLNDIIADMDTLLTELESEFYRVCIFGSARIGDQSDEYTQVFDLAKALSREGCDIVTGGGPGLMEAANKGAKAGSSQQRSIGLHIELPFETDTNMHLDVKRHHRRFSSRLDEFMRISHAVIVTPGGIGTLLEFFYTWQLMQVGHIKPRPLVLVGKQMWAGLLKWLQEEPLRRNLMSKSDMEIIMVVDSVDEVIDKLRPFIQKFKAHNA